jgi:hypothetical protein
LQQAAFGSRPFNRSGSHKQISTVCRTDHAGAILLMSLHVALVPTLRVIKVAQRPRARSPQIAKNFAKRKRFCGVGMRGLVEKKRRSR